jgi:hypothetical protein
MVTPHPPTSVRADVEADARQVGPVPNLLVLDQLQLEQRNGQRRGRVRAKSRSACRWIATLVHLLPVPFDPPIQVTHALVVPVESHERH